MNLIKNAVKFTRVGKIEIKAEYNDLLIEPKLQVEVIDTGAGIAPKDMNKLFTRFGKLQRTAVDNSEGIGLGLTIVQQIVKSSGGSITASSPGVGQGSTFTFIIPMNAVKEPNRKASQGISQIGDIEGEI